MRAVWSFWSEPYRAGSGFRWRAPVHHLLAWGLSFRLAQAHYPQTVLVTDSPGRALLAGRLGLPFSHVSTELDRLRGADPAWWALGKLTAYSLQDQPFVHLDTDVFLWQALPDGLAGAPVLAQHPETYHQADDRCGPRIVEDAFARAGVPLPAEWQWSRSRPARHFVQANCGIVGGTQVGFLRGYAQLALDLVLSPRHAAAWAAVPGKAELNTTVEQFLLVACAEYHRSDPASPHRGVYLRYLFPSTGAAFDPARAARLGYTHLLAEAKQDPQVTARLAARVRREDPAFYRRCERVAAAGGGEP
jgi:hypothetical protein